MIKFEVVVDRWSEGYKQSLTYCRVRVTSTAESIILKWKSSPSNKSFVCAVISVLAIIIPVGLAGLCVIFPFFHFLSPSSLTAPEQYALVLTSNQTRRPFEDRPKVVDHSGRFSGVVCVIFPFFHFHGVA